MHFLDVFFKELYLSIIATYVHALFSYLSEK